MNVAPKLAATAEQTARNSGCARPNSADFLDPPVRISPIRTEAPGPSPLSKLGPGNPLHMYGVAPDCDQVEVPYTLQVPILPSGPLKKHISGQPILMLGASGSSR